MQYLVNTCGEITTTETKSYLVDAKSKEEAEQIAKEFFKQEYDVEDGYAVYSHTYVNKRTLKVILSCLLMIVAMLVLWIPEYTNDSWWSNLWGTSALNVRPDLISCLCSIIFYAAYVIRFKGINKAVGNFLDVSLTIVGILIFSTFFKIINVSEQFKLFGIIPIPFLSPVNLIIFGLALSWIGTKIVSLATFGIVAIIAITNVNTISNAMGVFGAVYIICSFIGILLWLSVEPCILEAFPQYKKELLLGYNKMKKDLVDAKKEVKTAIANTKKDNL